MLSSKRYIVSLKFQIISTNELNRISERVWHVLQYLQKTGQVGLWSTGLFNVMLEHIKGSRAMAAETMISQTCLRSGRCLAVGVALPHARKTKLAGETCIIKNTHHVSKQHWNISIRQFKTFKRYPVFDLNYIKRQPKIITQAYWNHLESKNILKNVMLQDFMTNRCTSNNSQKHFSVRWTKSST